MTEKLVIDLMIAALTHATELGALIQTARAQGRDVSEAELDGVRAKYDVTRNGLLAEIAKARAT